MQNSNNQLRTNDLAAPIFLGEGNSSKVYKQGLALIYTPSYEKLLKDPKILRKGVQYLDEQWKKTATKQISLAKMMYDAKGELSGDGADGVRLTFTGFPIGKPLADIDSKSISTDSKPDHLITVNDAKQLFQQLGKLHGLGYRHNDIKRSNLILNGCINGAPSGAHIIDFGSCETIEFSRQNEPDHTQSKVFIGTMKLLVLNDEPFSIGQFLNKESSFLFDLESEIMRLFCTVLIDALVSNPNLTNNQVHELYGSYLGIYQESKSQYENQCPAVPPASRNSSQATNPSGLFDSDNNQENDDPYLNNMLVQSSLLGKKRPASSHGLRPASSRGLRPASSRSLSSLFSGDQHSLSSRNCSFSGLHNSGGQGACPPAKRPHPLPPFSLSFS